MSFFDYWFKWCYSKQSSELITIKEENLEEEVYNRGVSKVVPAPIELKKNSIKPNGDSTMNSNEFIEFQMKAKSKETRPQSKKKKLPITTRQISEADRLHSPLLGLEEQGDTDILNHNKIMINAGGLLGGREANDGVVYFSIPSNIINSKSESMKPVDYTLNVKHSIIHDLDYLFLIYYRQETKDYHIKFSENIGEANNEIYLHIYGNTMEIPLNKSEVISFGKILLQIVPNIKNNSIKLINLNEEDKMASTKIFNSTSQDITIGRSDQCSFCLENETDISKIQCTIYYNTEKKVWILIDGSREKRSLNGSWLIASHSYPLYDDIELELFSNIIKVKYY